MAKKALLDVLEQTIGKYVKNLDAESLNVAVWSGKIALNHLELDVDAVNAELNRQAAEAPNLALPIQVLSGQFQALEVDVPWASLTSKSVVLRAHGLQINVRPHDRLAETDFLRQALDSEEDRSAKVRKAREHSIVVSEQYRHQAYAVRKLAAETDEKNSSSSGRGHDSTPSSSFSSRLVRRIMENIQIEIQDVHISLTDAEGSAGVALESLSLVTTDKDGKRVFVDRTSAKQANSTENSFLHKMLLMEGFGIYLDHEDTNTEKFVTAKTSLAAIPEGRSSSRRASTSTSTCREERGAVIQPIPVPTPISPHAYILAPLSFQAKLRQADGSVCVDYAKYLLSSELSSLSVLLSKQQLEVARKIAKQMSSSESAAAHPLFPEYRPLTRVTSGAAAREWWRYALRCIGRLNGRRSWVELFVAYQKRKQYTPLYKREAHHEASSWIQPLTSSEADELVELEHDRTISVEGLMAWRNLADGQVDKEREKYEAKQMTTTIKKGASSSTTSYFSSIFGSPRVATMENEPLPEEEEEEDDPPIHLSFDELKELEAMSKEEFTEPELSKDSKLCDVQFILNSLRINLTSHDMRHLAALEMGAVSVDFTAAANGAFGFNFHLADLQIQDRSTPNSLFPSVLKSLQSGSDDEGADSAAFLLHLSKTKTGDQTLKIKLAAFEAVASQILFRELKRFVSNPPASPIRSGKKKNPILAQSLSGSVDLFYDADQGASLQLQAAIPEDEEVTMPVGELEDLLPKPKPHVTTDFSNVLVDAWKEKTASKASWVMDIDIKAPVIVIPEKCNDPRASILIFDLGRFRLTYGKISPSSRVLSWFENHPREHDSDPTLDSGSLEISDLTFKVGRANDWRLLTNGSGCQDKESSVIDPIAVSLAFGVESTIASADRPRICCVGVIPTISLRMSPSQGSKAFPVVGSWTSLLSEMEEENHGDGDSVQSNDMDSVVVQQTDNARSTSEDGFSSSEDLSEISEHGGEARPQFYFMIGLQQLSVTVSLDPRNRLETHLVSVYASASVMEDGSSVVGLRMGWFWVLDMLESKFARRQRLLVHSNLPRPADSFSDCDKYDMMDELRKQGVFDAEYTGSTDLADISFRTVGPRVIKAAKKRSEPFVESVLDAKFSSLFIHWNPNAIKGINEMVENFSLLADGYDDTSTLILTSERTPQKRKNIPDGQLFGQMLIRAQMQSLDFHLNSARDDLPLFVLTVAGAKINMLSSLGNMETSLSLGDVRVHTPEDMGRTLIGYRTLLGLAPGQTASLLTVKYYQGREAIKKISRTGEEREKLEAFAEVDLSPMRLCFLQSQIMALVEYSTEGILGALTAQAANSAAQAAIDIAESVGGKKLFKIRATGFGLILPEAAHSDNVTTIQAGGLDVDYYMYPGTEGSKAKVELSDVSLQGTDGEHMQQRPIRMSLDVVLPSDQVGSFNDQAMRVQIHMSEASFLVSKPQYAQILRTLAQNIGELELFLRDDIFSAVDGTYDATSERLSGDNPIKGLTHAGNEFVERQRRMYLNVSVEVLALQLVDLAARPLIQIAAVSALVEYQSRPDTEDAQSKVSLQNLVCEDLRPEAIDRQYRYLISQKERQASNDDTETENIFYIGYTAGKNESSLDLKVGSPQVVLIPDAIAEMLAFVQTEGDVPGDKNSSRKTFTDETDDSGQEIVQVKSDVDDGVEASLVSSRKTACSRISAATNTCRIVLVDLGTQLQNGQGKVEQLTETLVLQGVFSASLSSTLDLNTGNTIERDFNGEADAMEIFTSFGTKMKSPLQILEPADGSARGSMKSSEDGEGTEVEIRAAALTPFDFNFSMHNAALLNAILNSLKSSFAWGDDTLVGGDNSANETEELHLDGLSKLETARIENLASALEAPSQEEEASKFSESMSSMGDNSVAPASHHSSSVQSGSNKIQVKVTMPETRITFINDLQGLDEALFRVSVTNFVAGGELDQRAFPNTTFDFHMNTNVLADYFDTSCNIWNNLLIRPWEITLKGIRAPSRRIKSNRLSTTIDLESFPCCVSFSEQFLVSLASASRMWSIYSVATAVHLSEEQKSKGGSLRASMAASAARNLITSLPYAIENHCGVNATFMLPGLDQKFACQNGTVQYFRFEPPRGGGFGGKRSYGQDLDFEKTISVYLNDETVIEVPHLDYEFGLLKRSHRLKNGGVVLSHVVKEGKTTVLHLTSHISIINNTSIPFNVCIVGDCSTPIGVCGANNLKRGNEAALLTSSNGIASKHSRSFSVPVAALKSYSDGWRSDSRATVTLSVSPSLHDKEYPRLSGLIDIDASLRDIKKANDGRVVSKFDVICSPERNTGRTASAFVVQVLLKITVTPENEPCVAVSLEPRALIENRFPVGIKLRTPMPHTFSSSSHAEILGKDVVYNLEERGRVEVFTPGPSIAVTIKTADSPIAGSDLDWLDGGWIDLPLVTEFRLLEPVRCLLPFNNDIPALLSTPATRGSEFFIAEGAESLAILSAPSEGTAKKSGENKGEQTFATPSVDVPLRTFFVTVCFYGIDHTGDLLIEQVSKADKAFRRSSTMDDSFKQNMHDSLSNVKRRHSRKYSSSLSLTPFGAFASNHHHRRITLLPSGNTPLRILQMTMEGDAGFRKSHPFFIEELPIGHGGVDTIPILWEDKGPSGYYAYRSISNEHQSEVHIVPEFVVFNGSRQIVLVKEKEKPEVIIEGGKVSRLGVDSRQDGLEIALFFIELDCRSSFLRVDKLGMKVAVLKSSTGMPVGSVCVQTVIDTRGDARLVVKIGKINRGHFGSGIVTRQPSMFSEDFVRFRVRWTELQLILNELQHPEFETWSVEKALAGTRKKHFSPDEQPSKLSPSPVSCQPSRQASSTSQKSRFPFLSRHSSKKEAERRMEVAQILQQPIATIILSRFTFDFQRVFKDDSPRTSSSAVSSPERSQISLIVHNVIVKDLTPDSSFPMVFDCSSNTTSFLDLCVRIRGPTNAELVMIDLFDLNLAHSNGNSERIKLTTSEDYVWRLLDLTNRILDASGQLAGFALKLEEDKDHGGFIVQVVDNAKNGPNNEVEYSPPKSDTLYDINVARVSPFALLVSFKRNPQIARYKKVNSKVHGSAMMNYFSRRLKFTIDRADLTFARYENRSMKGPPDRLFEGLFAVYMSRMKFKLVTLLTSASLQDWKFLAARDNGEDEYVEGDVLRATGNLSGKMSSLLLKRAGQTLGDGVSDFSRAVGHTIERTSDKIGAGRVGAGVNSVVSGVGDGVGSAVSGVGSGTGKILKGAGQGIGQAFGGVAGGAMQIGKGIGKGIAKGDGKALVSGIMDGASSAGGGLAQGAESAVVGVADGLFHVGRGLFSGVKSAGKGIGGAFTGKKPERKDRR